MDYIKISLLPADLKRQSSVMRRWTIMALILSIIAVTFFIISYLFTVYLQGPVAELQKLEENNSIMTNNISRLSYFQEMFDEIENNNSIIVILEGNKVDWKYTFDLVSNDLTLYNINAKQIKIDEKAEGVNGFMIAECDTIAMMTAWADSTRLVEGIDNVVLENITKINPNTENETFYFEVMITISKWNAE